MLNEFNTEHCDPGIRKVVEILREHDVETCQSCQGGDGHPYQYPTVDFIGVPGQEFIAFGKAIMLGLPVTELSIHWDTGLTSTLAEGPTYRLEFSEYRLKAQNLWEED